MHFNSRGSGRYPDGQRLLGVVLPRARDSTRRSNAFGQNLRRLGWLILDLLRGNRRRKTRAQGRVRGLGAFGHRYEILFTFTRHFGRSPIQWPPLNTASFLKKFGIFTKLNLRIIRAAVYYRQFWLARGARIKRRPLYSFYAGFLLAGKIY